MRVAKAMLAMLNMTMTMTMTMSVSVGVTKVMRAPMVGYGSLAGPTTGWGVHWVQGADLGEFLFVG